MTSISSVNTTTTTQQAASTQCTAQKSKLSEATKAKLQALGITATDDMTETEAQQLIAQAQTQQAGQNGGGSQNSTESELLSEAKSLASMLGVSVDDDADISTILEDIGAEIEEMLEGAENNPSVLSTVSSYISQLTSLDEQNDSLQTAKANYYAALDAISNNNKIALGLE